ncbi:MAG TPA: M20 family metallopeptidase, partial [Gemmatimonadaceae bacterium]|nr:M20 family metallopeptidase [Gemmatimonadaceae bacterium]
ASVSEIAVPTVVEQHFSPDDARRLVELRRDLHRHPELSWNEQATSERLVAALASLGITDVERVAGTGLVARVPGRDRSAPIVAVRGDIDALPITENTGLPFASENPGVMHACGHDVHASWAVGAAMLLAREPAAGDVLVVFQPAEELGDGARAIVESGALANVAAIFGGHVDRRFEVGQVVAQAGALAASTDSFDIEIVGAGAHGARPHESKDPIVAAAAIITALQTLVSRRLDPAQPGVVTVGTINAGTAANIIPDRARLTGTIRATTVQARTLLTRELENMVAAVAAAYGVTATTTLSGGTPPIVNPERMAAIAARATASVLGDAANVPLGTTNMGGEDFAVYMETIPGCFLRIGAREPGGRVIGAHSPEYYAAEGALFIGAAVLAEAARIASAEFARGG